MEIIKVVGFAIFSLVMIIVLQENKKEFALMLSILSGVLIIIFALTKLTPILDMLYSLSNKSLINSEYLIIILKVIGIAYIVEFGKNVCKDASQNALATKIEMAGKIIVVSLTIPIINSLITIITGLV